MNALFDIIVLGVSVYITLCNVREQVCTYYLVLVSYDDDENRTIC